jgi:hypothetical protein
MAKVMEVLRLELPMLVSLRPRQPAAARHRGASWGTGPGAISSAPMTKTPAPVTSVFISTAPVSHR